MKIRFLMRLLCLTLILNLMAGLPVASALQDDDTRGIWDTGFLKKRKASASQSPTRKKIRYKVQTRVEDKKPTLEDLQANKTVVGITFWKWRRSETSDDKAVRILEREDDKETEWTPVRVESDTLFAPGDRVRLSFESPRTGYLYVINRETYSDGTSSEPHLIFPTMKDYGGDNYVQAGRVIDIPRTKFVLKSNSAKYSGEEVTFLFSPTKLTEVSVPDKMTKLPAAQVQKWEEMWRTAKVERYELDEGKGKAYTKAEKEAGESATRLLTQEDELPQTLIVLDAKPDSPILFTLQMKLRK